MAHRYRGERSGVCGHCGWMNDSVGSYDVIGFRLELCSYCLGPFFKMLAMFTPHREWTPTRNDVPSAAAVRQRSGKSSRRTYI
jgi:hypothetical protein